MQVGHTGYRGIGDDGPCRPFCFFLHSLRNEAWMNSNIDVTYPALVQLSSPILSTHWDPHGRPGTFVLQMALLNDSAVFIDLYGAVTIAGCPVFSRIRANISEGWPMLKLEPCRQHLLAGQFYNSCPIFEVVDFDQIFVSSSAVRSHDWLNLPMARDVIEDFVTSGGLLPPLSVGRCFGDIPRAYATHCDELIEFLNSAQSLRILPVVKWPLLAMAVCSQTWMTWEWIKTEFARALAGHTYKSLSVGIQSTKK